MGDEEGILRINDDDVAETERGDEAFVSLHEDIVTADVDMLSERYRR